MIFIQVTTIEFFKQNLSLVQLKPFLYSAAFENGYNPSSIILDAPIVFEDDNLEDVWRPKIHPVDSMDQQD